MFAPVLRTPVLRLTKADTHFERLTRWDHTHTWVPDETKLELPGSSKGQP